MLIPQRHANACVGRLSDRKLLLDWWNYKREKGELSVCDAALPSSQLLPAPLIGFLFAQQWCWIMIRRLWLQQLIPFQRKKSAEIGWPLRFPAPLSNFIIFLKKVYILKHTTFSCNNTSPSYCLFFVWLFIGAAQTIDGLILSRPGTTFILLKKLLWITHDSLSRREDIEKKIHAEAAAAEDEKILCVYITAAPFAWWLNLSCVLIATKYQHNCPVYCPRLAYQIFIFSTRLKLFLFYFHGWWKNRTIFHSSTVFLLLLYFLNTRRSIYLITFIIFFFSSSFFPWLYILTSYAISVHRSHANKRVSYFSFGPVFLLLYAEGRRRRNPAEVFSRFIITSSWWRWKKKKPAGISITSTAAGLRSTDKKVKKKGWTGVGRHLSSRGELGSTSSKDASFYLDFQ